MPLVAVQEDVRSLVDGLNFAQKVNRSLGLIREAYEEYGNRLVVANSLGKDSVAVWDLAKRVSPDIRGFIVTTRFKPCLLYTSPSPRDRTRSRMPSSA